MAGQSRAQYALQLHQRLLQGDPVAPSELVEAFLEELERRLRARAPRVNDAALITDAAADALLSYVQQPEKFDPSKSGLMTYLTMSAHGDLLNTLSRERTRGSREVPLEDVEHRLASRNNTEEGLEEGVLEGHGIVTSGDRAAFLSRVAGEFPDPQDHQILQLILDGERKTGAYSKVLGIETLDEREQRRIVKRHKDRINKRLRRLGGKLSGQK